MNCNKVKSPIITPVIAAGATASPYYVLCNITQQLCYSTCAEDTPVFAPTFSLKQYTEIAAGQYVATINVTGIISYVRCSGNNSNSCACCTQQPVNAEFTVPFASTTSPTSVIVTQGASINALAANGCADCSRQFVSETPLTLTIT